MKEPLISVLIPTYNVDQFIEEAISSILNQTYKNLEIIIVDDGSKDSTFEKLLHLAGEDSRIKLYKNQTNLKIVETLNTAFKYSTGDYIARMDGDDISCLTRLAEQFVYLQNHPELSLVGCNVIMIDEDGKEIHKQEYLSDFKAIKVASRYYSPVNHFWLAKRDVYLKVGEYRIPTVEDYDFILRAIDCGFKVSNVPAYLYMQRIRKGNTATSAGLLQRKSRHYVRLLSRERLKGGLDSYSAGSLEKALATTKLESLFFNWSSRLHHSYISTKNKSFLAAICYRLGSIALAPREQITHIYERWRYKRLFK